MQATNMLDTFVHARIIADIEQVCITAGLQKKFLHESMKDYCEKDEIDWVQNFHQYRDQGLLGLVLVKVKRPDVRCQAICAALIRNFIDSRVIPLNSLLDMQESGSAPSPTVLLVPNLYTTASGKTLASYRVQLMYDLLLQRSVQNKPSVLWIENLEGVQNAYGVPFADFLSNYRSIQT